MVNDALICGDGAQGFSRLVISSSCIDSEPFGSSLIVIGSFKGILIYIIWGSFSSWLMTLWAPSSNNNPLLCDFVVFLALIYSLILRASWVDCSIVSTCSSILISLNLVMFGLDFLCNTSSKSSTHFVKLSSLNLSCAYGKHVETCEACWRERPLGSCLHSRPVGNLN